MLGLDPAGALVPPTDYGQAGWYGGGPAPGDTGPAVLAGHLDSRAARRSSPGSASCGPATGSRCGVATGWLPFRVTGSLRTRKDRFPTAVVYGPTPGPELRLVTCGGDFDRRPATTGDNVVVFAVTEPRRPGLPGVQRPR